MQECAQGAAITLVGLGINVLLFIVLTSMNPAFIPEVLISTETVGLLGGFSLDFIITLGLLLFAYSLTVPSSLIGGIMGGLISRTGVAE